MCLDKIFLIPIALPSIYFLRKREISHIPKGKYGVVSNLSVYLQNKHCTIFNLICFMLVSLCARACSFKKTKKKPLKDKLFHLDLAICHFCSYVNFWEIGLNKSANFILFKSSSPFLHL